MLLYVPIFKVQSVYFKVQILHFEIEKYKNVTTIWWIYLHVKIAVTARKDSENYYYLQVSKNIDEEKQKIGNINLFMKFVICIQNIYLYLIL